MKLNLFNTLSRKKEVFKPIKKGKVGMYSCGPTVYWFAHIGNMRTYVFSDILKRVLAFNGFKVKHVMNVTDVGHLSSGNDSGIDKMESASKKEGKNAKEIAKFYFKAFEEDMKKLNIVMPEVWSKATEHIKEQIELVKKLEKKGFTYKTSDGIYFDSSKFKDYGKLARVSIEGLKKGKRVSFGEKKNKHDFALWKFSDNPGSRQQEWDSPWGVGFPGWHLECSAMSMKYLGERIDIHTGGIDHIPIHHTNEIAQSESASGKKFVNYWLHGAFLLNKGKKASKSTGGFYTVSELEEKEYSPLHFRYLCLMTHYRKPLQFSLENLEAAGNAYRKLERRVGEIREEKHKGKDLTKKYEKMFLESINDDLNTSKALDVLWKVVDDFDFTPVKKIKLLERFDEVFGLKIKDMQKEETKIPNKILTLVEKRNKLRTEKKWAEADIIRNRLKEEGYLVEDKESGVEIRKV